MQIIGGPVVEEEPVVLMDIIQEMAVKVVVVVVHQIVMRED